jgi:prefoldin subunit 5
MTDTPQKSDTPAKSEDPAELLRAAVTAAQASPAEPKPADAASPSPAAVCEGRRFELARLRVPAIAAGLVLAASLGFGAARLSSSAEPQETALRWSEAASSLRQSHDDLAQTMTELRHLKLSVESVKGERDRLRTDLSAKQAQISERLDRLASDNAARVGKLAEQMDRIEKTQRDPARLQDFVERLERIEKKTQLVADKVAAPPKVAASADVTQTGSLADAKPAAKAPEADPRKTPLDGYVLRDVADGFALIEGKNGRMVEVQAGQMLAPGTRVEAIERRGRQWVVVTAKGFIAEQRWP